MRFLDFELLRFIDSEILRFVDFEILRFVDFEIYSNCHVSYTVENEGSLLSTKASHWPESITAHGRTPGSTRGGPDR